MDRQNQLPCQVIAGSLGVGKTTAILHLLQSLQGRAHVAVIVNDFGLVGLDAEILRQSSDDKSVDIRNVPGGCLCCSSASGLEDAIGAVVQLQGITHIIVEPSGLAIMPDFMARMKALAARFSLDLRPVVTLISPKRTKLRHYESLPFFRSMIDHADILVANRTDQCPEEDLEHFRQWTAALPQPKLAVIETSYGRLPESVLTLSANHPAASHDEHHHHHHHHEYAGGFTDQAFTAVSREQTVQLLRQWADAGIDGVKLLRLKALLPTDEGGYLFEIADGVVYERPLRDTAEAKLDWISNKELKETAIYAELEKARLSDMASS